MTSKARTQRIGRWHKIFKQAGVPSNKMAKAINKAIDNQWIEPGCGNRSTSSALKSLGKKLKKHGLV